MNEISRLRSDRGSVAQAGAYAPWIGLPYILFVALFMVTATVLSWPLPEMAFRSDNSPVSWLSSAQLWAIAVIVARLLTERAVPLAAGIVLLVAMIAMAFDEQFMFHELWKYSCGDWFELCRYAWVRDGPMVLVGVGGVATAAWLHLVIPPGWARLYLWSGIALGVVALSVDLLDPLPMLTAYEEGFEVLAEAFFLACLLGLRAQKTME